MKVWNYIFIAVTMMIFFQFAGFPTAFDTILTFFGIEFDSTGGLGGFSLNTSQFILYAITAFGTLTALGLTIGIFFQGKSEVGIKAGFATAVLILFVPTLYFTVSYAINELHLADWAVGILALIFIPFSIGFVMALWEYVVGGNTD